MQKFSEFVNDYRKYLKANGMDSNVSPDQVKRIRELYESLNTKKSKIKESEDSDPNKAEDGDGTCECGDPNCDGEECKGDEKIEESKSFQEMLAKYREWKFKTKGTRGVTMREKDELKAKLMNKKKPLDEKTKTDMGKLKIDESIEGFKAVVAKYREWKMAKYNTSKLTEDEKETLKSKFLEKISHLNEDKTKTTDTKSARFTEALEQYKKWKLDKYKTSEVTKFEEAQISKGLVLDDIKAKLDEAKKLVESGKKHLTEGDVMDAGADAQAAAGAVNDATAMGADPALAGDPNMAADPNAGAALPQNIVDEISQIKTSIDSLATECGIESPVDLGADAGAGVPAVTGAADPNVDATAAAPAPAPAGAPAEPGAAPLPESIKSVKARIAARNAQLKETIKFSNTKMVDGAKDDMVKIPSDAELTNGTKSISANVKKATWPITDVKPGDAKKVKNIEECTQEELAKMTLNEDNQFCWANYTKLLKSL